jgi:alkylated DNA repair dioxygenase AlkB
MTDPQLSLFAAPDNTPAGLRYTRDILSPAEEAKLISFIESLPLKPFEFTGGFRGNRRIHSFGWRYDFNRQKVELVDPIPPELLGLRQAAAEAVERPAAAFEQALMTEYAPGAGIGWHKDRPMFDDVIGVSLAAPCRFRFRRKLGDDWLRYAFAAEARSAYLLSGASRTQWQHSIPPVDRLRYSITYRSIARRI